MNLGKLIRQVPNLLTEEQCLSMVNKYESTGRNDMFSLGTTPGWADEDSLVFKAMIDPILEYTNELVDDFDFRSTNFMDHGYWLHKTEGNVGSDIKSHFKFSAITDLRFISSRDVCCNLTRETIFTYIIHLNKPVGGRTIVHIGNEKHYIQPEIGKLVMFPTYPFYRYSDEEILEGSKYVLCGFTTSDRVAKSITPPIYAQS